MSKKECTELYHRLYSYCCTFINATGESMKQALEDNDNKKLKNQKNKVKSCHVIGLIV